MNTTVKGRHDSYTMGVAPRKNKVWSDQERLIIYNMKIKSRLSSGEISNIMGVTQVQVNNALEAYRKKVFGKCAKCGHTLEESDLAGVDTTKQLGVLCKKCKKDVADYKEARRLTALKAGLCSYCLTNPVVPGHTGCQACISATHRRRNLAGLCGACGKRPFRKDSKKGTVALCDECTEQMRLSKRNSREKASTKEMEPVEKEEQPAIAMQQWEDYQKVDINNDATKCSECGSILTRLSGFVYAGESRSGADFKEELCKCKVCQNPFVMRYELFDKDGHILSKVFTGDINNPDYNWQELLTEEQKRVIAEHLKDCKTCQDRLSSEILSDAWLSEFMNELRKGANIKIIDPPHANPPEQAV